MADDNVCCCELIWRSDMRFKTHHTQHNASANIDGAGRQSCMYCICVRCTVLLEHTVDTHTAVRMYARSGHRGCLRSTCQARNFGFHWAFSGHRSRCLRQRLHTNKRDYPVFARIIRKSNNVAISRDSSPSALLQCDMQSARRLLAATRRGKIETDQRLQQPGPSSLSPAQRRCCSR